jgi:outer membrane receptor protein involved in Fe transport
VMSRIGRSIASGAVVLALLAGCSTPPSYDPEAAERLQQHVLAVSTSAAAGDWGGAQTRLAELEASATTALARGTITQARFDAIVSALALVRADLEAEIAAAEQREAELAAEELARQQAIAEEEARQAAARLAEETFRDGSSSSGSSGNSGGNKGKGNKKDD